MSPATEPLPADLVLEGGGVKGIALAGALSELLTRYRFRRVAGTSAGAIAAALVAAGLDAGGVRDVLGRLRYDRIPDSWFPVPALAPATGLLLREGAHPGRYVHEWLHRELADLGVITFGDLRRDDPGDDPHLTSWQRYKLVVMATDVTRGRLLRLPWDYQEYGLDPDEQPVADAVRMSMAIPLYFAPCTLTDRTTGRRSTIVDGGVLSNFPIEVFDRTDDVPPRWPTFGVGITDPGAEAEVSLLPRWLPRPVPAIRLIDSVLATAISGHDRTYLATPCVRRRAFEVDASAVGLTDFDVDAATRERLFTTGQQAARTFLARWDWAAYLRDCRGVR
jgi:NTE family protein